MSLQEISFIPTECIDFPILNDFMTINDLINMSFVNKHFNSIAKKQLKRILLFIEKLEEVVILKNISSLYSFSNINVRETNALNNTNSDSFKNNRREILPYLNEKRGEYNPLYWYKLFGGKLNSQGLALYYVYFILNYHIPAGRMESTIDPYLIISKWNCVSFEDGFIKSLAGCDNSFSMSQDKSVKEHYILISKKTKFEPICKDCENETQYFNYNMKYHHDIEFNYMTSKLENVFSIDEELLKRVYCFIQNNRVYNETEKKFVYPSIKKTIMNFYPIFTHI